MTCQTLKDRDEVFWGLFVLLFTELYCAKVIEVREVDSELPFTWEGFYGAFCKLGELHFHVREKRFDPPAFAGESSVGVLSDAPRDTVLGAFVVNAELA